MRKQEISQPIVNYAAWYRWIDGLIAEKRKEIADNRKRALVSSHHHSQGE